MMRGMRWVCMCVWWRSLERWAKKWSAIYLIDWLNSNHLVIRVGTEIKTRTQFIVFFLHKFKHDFASIMLVLKYWNKMPNERKDLYNCDSMLVFSNYCLLWINSLIGNNSSLQPDYTVPPYWSSSQLWKVKSKVIE